MVLKDLNIVLKLLKIYKLSIKENYIHASPLGRTIPTLEQRLATSKALKAHFLANDHHNKGKKGVLAPQFGIGGTKIHMYSSDEQYKYFPSINAAATQTIFSC